VLLVIGAMVVGSLPASSVSGVADVSGSVGVAAALLFFAAAAAGGVVGFLFALPRARFIDPVEPVPRGQSLSDPAASPATSPRSGIYLANSNLIKGSEGLTTIIVGLGLVNLTRIGLVVARLRAALTQPLGGSSSAGPIGWSTVTVGLLAGFLLVNLWTTVRVREMLEASQLERERVPALPGRSLREARAMMASAGRGRDGP
jgi:hypothetical protein